MAEGKSSPSILDKLEEGIKEYWAWILVAIIVYLIFVYGFQNIVIWWILIFAGVYILGRIAWKMWIHYIQQDFIAGIDFVLLEIIPPREVLRSPKAMELFITNALYHWSQKSGKEEYWQGAVWFWFSLEIVSIDGQVHFYIRTPTRVRGLIETQMYAQYPQAQIKAVEDYTLGVPEITPESEWNAWGCEFDLEKPEAYPIKTYVDFGLDKDPKEEFKIDPLSPLVELFGSIGKGEQMWMQIVITPSKKEYHTKGTLFGKHDWIKESANQIYKLLAPYSSVKEVDTVKAAGGIGFKRARIEIRVPPHLDDVIKRMRMKPAKLGFDTGVRVMYLAKKEIYPPGTRTNNSRNIRLIFRQYSDPNMNGLKRVNSAQGDAYSGIFTASNETVMMLANRMLNEYRERSFFHLPLRHNLFNNHTIPWPLSGMVKAYIHPPTYVLNTEELATLWHFPGQIMRVPTLERIESKEASPPPNLPI
jgi:hypothetical protein